MKTYNVNVERNETYNFNIESYNPVEAEKKALKSLFEHDPVDMRTDISVIEMGNLAIGKPKKEDK